MWLQRVGVKGNWVGADTTPRTRLADELALSAADLLNSIMSDES